MAPTALHTYAKEIFGAWDLGRLPVQTGSTLTATTALLACGCCCCIFYNMAACLCATRSVSYLHARVKGDQAASEVTPSGDRRRRSTKVKFAALGAQPSGSGYMC